MWRKLDDKVNCDDMRRLNFLDLDLIKVYLDLILKLRPNCPSFIWILI
jgi:hypothetical protein